jgi:hypothetical protein
MLKVEKQLKNWREKGQREAQWFTLEEAAELVQEPGLVALLQNLAQPGAALTVRWVCGEGPLQHDT